MDAESRQRLPVPAQEHILLTRLAAGELFQFARGGGPQRAEADFVSLPVKLDKRLRYLAGMYSEIADREPSCRRWVAHACRRLCGPFFGHWTPSLFKWVLTMQYKVERLSGR